MVTREITESVDNLRNVLNSVFFVPFIYQFLFLVPIFLNSWESADRLSDGFKEIFRKKDDRYDFIIVGAGTSGSVVAEKLSRHYKVLVLDVGGTPNPLQLIPAFQASFLARKQTDFIYRSVPQKRACSLAINQEASLSSGKVLGGSSAIGYMTHFRGHPRDYDNWAALLNDWSWSYDSLLPHFKRLENFKGATTDRLARGSTGKLHIERSNFHDLGKLWVLAGKEVGYQNVDFNGHYNEGFGLLQYTMKNGMRQSGYGAFLQGHISRPNLNIRLYSEVKRLLFRDEQNTVGGVEFIKNGQIGRAYAKKEVILSAGTLGTPKILFASGIGPLGILERAGVSPRPQLQLPVGENLQDHLAVFLGPFFIDKATSLSLDRDIKPESFIEWVSTGTGPLTTSGYQAAAAVSSTLARSLNQGDWPDLSLLVYGNSFNKQFIADLIRSYNLQGDVIKDYYELNRHSLFQRRHEETTKDSFHIIVQLSRPKSRGYLVYEPHWPGSLKIEPGYLSDPDDLDLKVLLDGIAFALNMVENSTVFQQYRAHFTSVPLPGCDHLEFRTPIYFECYARKFTVSSHHFVGTAALGAVVDSSLLVTGTPNLRILDCSVQPFIVTGGTQASAFMLGEKGSEIILERWGIPYTPKHLSSDIFGFKNPLTSIFIQNDPLKWLSIFSNFNPLQSIFSLFNLLNLRGSQTSDFNLNIFPSSSNKPPEKFSHDPGIALFIQNVIDGWGQVFSSSLKSFGTNYFSNITTV